MNGFALSPVSKPVAKEVVEFLGLVNLLNRFLERVLDAAEAEAVDKDAPFALLYDSACVLALVHAKTNDDAHADQWIGNMSNHHAPTFVATPRFVSDVRPADNLHPSSWPVPRLA